MTGDCGNRSAPGYKVFERIAAASFGQVFHLEKSHVNTGILMNIFDKKNFKFSSMYAIL